MKNLPNLFIVAIAALLLVAVATGQVAQTHDPLAPDAPTPPRKRAPNPPADRSKVTLPSFSLEVKADKTTAEIGGKLKVWVTLTNTSEQDIFYDGFGHNRPFGLEVRDETGELVARTPEGLTAQWAGGSEFPVPIRSGESIRRFARLDKEFKLDRPGNYFVQAVRGISNTNFRRSNTITITIMP